MIPFKQRDLVRDKVFDSDLLPCINKPITRIYPQHWFDNSIAEFWILRVKEFSTYILSYD